MAPPTMKLEVPVLNDGNVEIAEVDAMSIPTAPGLFAFKHPSIEHAWSLAQQSTGMVIAHFHAANYCVIVGERLTEIADWCEPMIDRIASDETLRAAILTLVAQYGGFTTSAGKRRDYTLQRHRPHVEKTPEG